MEKTDSIETPETHSPFQQVKHTNFETVHVASGTCANASLVSHSGFVVDVLPYDCGRGDLVFHKQEESCILQVQIKDECISITSYLQGSRGGSIDDISLF